MIRLSSLLAASVIAAGFAPASFAQVMPGTAAKAAAHKAADATTAHIEAEQRPDGPSRPTAVVSTVSNGDVHRDTVKSVGKKGLAVGAKSDTAAMPTAIMREEYAYSRDGRRDPFYSLLATSELRPTIGDLRLTGILFDRSGGNRSVATLRDVATNMQYRVFVGSTLGRMRVTTIRMKAVIFTIDEFGTSRQDSLFLGDSTRMRVK